MTPINADPGSLEPLIHDHLRLVYAAALRQTRRADLAEDVTQAVFILFLQKYRWIPAEHIAGWLVKTAYFTSRQAMRTEQRRTYHEKQAAMNIPRSTNEPSSDLSEVLDRALSRLAIRSRTALVLRYLEGRPLAEVAQTLQVSENAASKIITRGLDKLRGLLQNENPNLSLVPTPLPAALLDIAAKSPVADVSHLSARILTRGVAPKASSAALAHATGKVLLWAKMQAMATILCTMLVVAGAGGIALHETGWMARAAAPAPRLQFRLVDKPGAAATQPFTLMTDVSPQGEKLAVDNQILMDESSIQSAAETPSQEGPGYSIDITFTPSGAAKDAQITKENIGRRLAIVFDGKLLSAPTIRSVIRSRANITGEFSKAEADAIVAALNANHPVTPATDPSTRIIIRAFGYRLNPEVALDISSSFATNTVNTFISLQNQRIVSAPSSLTWNVQSPLPFNPQMDQWLRGNDIDLLIVAGDQKAHIFPIRANYIPAATTPESTTADLVDSTMKKTSRWNTTFPESVSYPFNFYVQDYSEHLAIASLANDAKSPGIPTLRYRLIQPDPTRPQDEHLALADSEFLYARTYSNPTRAGLRITVAGDRLRQLGKTDHYYTGGLFLNGELLTIGWFDLGDRSFTSDIFSTVDTTPESARAIAEQLNQATPDNGYKRFIRLYSLRPGEVLRHIPPPYPPERKYAMWPVPISTNGLIILNSNNGELVAHQYTAKLQTLPLADMFNDVAGLQNYDFVVDPSLLKINLAGDFVVDPSAKPEAKLAALQEIISTKTGQKIRITKSIVKRPVIIAMGHYGFAPLPDSNHSDAIAITATTINMTSQEQDSGSDSWQGMLDMIGDYIGMRVINMVENPPKSVKWANYASIWTTYNAAAQTNDPKQLNALLQILAAQTNLDFKIETRDEPTYLINAAP